MTHAEGKSLGFCSQVHSLTRMLITHTGCESLSIIGSRSTLLNMCLGCELLSGYFLPSWMIDKAV